MRKTNNMTFEEFFNKLRSIVLKLKKQGFTLSEALIITIMTGFCMLPILGTMQNAQTRTEAFDHYSKMQMYARSRLTAEIANASFDHKSINIDDEYNYIVYFATGTNEQKLIELPKSKVTFEELASVSKEVAYANHLSSDAYELIGVKSGAYKLDIIHAYKTSVAIKENPSLAALKEDLSTATVTLTPKGLLAIGVKTSLIYSNDSNEQYYNPNNGYLTTISYPDEVASYTDDDTICVPPVSLFSFVNLPVTSDDYIWISDVYNKKVYGIDSVSKSIVATIDMKKLSSKKTDELDELIPWHLAIHPNLKMLAIQTKNCIAIANIDSSSKDYGKVKEIVSGTNFSSSVKENDGTVAYNDGGIVFRPDGKCLFSISNANKQIYATKLDYSIDYSKVTKDLNWDSVKGNSVATYSVENKITNIVESNDGYLYVAVDKTVKRFPMYSNDDFSNWKGEDFITASNTINSITLSPDGSRIAIIVNNEDLNIYNTIDGRLLTNKQIKETNKFTPFKAYYANVFDSDNINSNKEQIIHNPRGLNIIVTNNDDKDNNIANYYYASMTSDISSISISLKKMKSVLATGTVATYSGIAVVNPATNTILINSPEKSNFYFSTLNATDTTEKLYSESIIHSNSENKNVSDMVANKRDILAVAASSTIFLYDTNTLNIIEDEVYKTATASSREINTMAINPQGDMILVGYGNNSGYTRFNLLDSNKDKSTPTPSSDSGLSKKVVFDDRTPNMAFALEDNNSARSDEDAFYNIDKQATFWDSSDSYNRGDFDLSTDWTRLDIIGMPRGGAMTLYGKSDGSSMLEWIGRRNWKDDKNKGKYRLFARWVSLPDKAPNLRVPEYGFENFKDNDTVDTWKGRIHVIRNLSIPLNSKVLSLNAWAGNWVGGGSRSITPLILEELSIGSFTIKDYGNSISMVSNATGTYPISWNGSNKGVILKSNQRLGFYAGSPSGDDDGVIRYYKSDSYIYLSDYYVDGGESSELEGVINYTDLTDSSKVFSEFPNAISGGKGRVYALTFNIVTPTSDFPPLGSKKLAIDPNQSLLAILATDTSNTPVVNFYDFNNYNYGPETQIEGMLVDYREAKDSGEYKPGYIIRPWPYETGEFLFQKAISDASFSNSKINTFASATTKFDSWESFNNYPANYYFFGSTDNNQTLNKNKIVSNKRIFGYFRPEYSIKQFQSLAIEDVRYFCNNLFLRGLTGKYGDFTASDNKPIKNISDYPFTSSLLQIDQTYDGEGSWLSFFVATNTEDFSDKTNNVEIPSSDQAEKNILKPKNLSSWSNLKSEQTYILKNHPSFIASYSTNTTFTISSSTSMIFSRDKANPILYLKGDNNLWAFSEKGYVKFNDTINFSTNLAISGDGQKLIFGTSDTSNPNLNYLNFYNIASPSDSIFTLTGASTALNDSTIPASYACLIASISLEEIGTGTPKVLATKPYTSFNSSPTGGKYKTLSYTSSESVTFITNNSLAVATGSIYLLANDNKIFGFNTLDNKLLYKTTLNYNSTDACLACYDDTVYAFGDNDMSWANPKSGKVQCFYTNSGNINSSIFNSKTNCDDYWANMCLWTTNFDEDNSPVIIKSGSTSVSSFNFKAENVFDSFDDTKNVGWKNHGDDFSDKSKIWVSYKVYDSDNKFLVNKLEINNKMKNAGSIGVKDFKFYGINGSDKKLLVSGSVGKDISDYIIHFYNDVAYQEYSFFCDSSHGSGDYVGLSEIKLCREGLKRLTPPVDKEVIIEDREAHSFSWILGDGNKCMIKTTVPDSPTSPSSAYNGWELADFYPDNYVDNYYNNPEFSESCEAWVVKGGNHYIMLNMTKPEILKVVRYCNTGTSNYLKKFTLYGSNATSPNPTNLTFSDWSLIDNFNNCPQICKTWVTREVNNNKHYKWYLISIPLGSSDSLSLSGLELYASYLPMGDSLTPMLTDDLGEVKVSSSAACSTPYGLVVAGGNVGSSATSTALLYWPHAINKFTGTSTQFGISRSLPPMIKARANHSLVWHKGKIYALGGLSSESDFAEILDYNSGKMIWASASSFIYTDEAGNGYLDRKNQGCCSFGDEIFIFGGESSGGVKLDTAIAWNPETNVVRKLNNIPIKLSPCSAVAYGSKIYIFGMDSSSRLKILEYAP